MCMEAVVFDFFGVLCTDVAPSWLRSHFSLEETQRIKEKYVAKADLGFISYEKMMLALSRLVDSTSLQINDQWASRAHIHQDVVDIVRALKPEYKIGLCTNAPSAFVRPILAAFDLEPLFDGIIVSSEIGHAKPDPEIYRATLSALDIPADQALMIDDSPRCIAGAEEVGMQAVLFKSAGQISEYLQKEKFFHGAE
jgi:HAD superfamily hydrolase (TIGR01509 family)